MWWLLTMTAAGMPLQTALDAAEQRSPALELTAHRLVEAEAQVREVRGKLLPSATVQAAAVAQREVTVNLADNLLSALPEVPFFDPSQIDAEPLVVMPGFQLQAAAEVTQPLVVPQAWAANKATAKAVDVARADQGAQAGTLRRAVLQSWYTSAEAKALVADAEMGVELAERLVERGEAMVEHGVAAPDQVLPFKRALASARANLAMARAGSQTADGVLTELTGLAGGADPVTAPAEVPGLEAALGQIERADLKVAETRRDAAAAARVVEQRAFWPMVAAKAGVYLVDPAPDLGVAENWRVQIGATVPLFQGGSVAARVQGASARVAQAEAGQRALQEKARIEVRAAHGTLARSMASLDAMQEALDLAEQSVDAAEKRLGEGGGSLLEVQQAQADQLAARAALTRAIAGAARAESALWMAVRDTP